MPMMPPLIPGAPGDRPQFDTLFLAIDKLAKSNCDCKDLLPVVLEIANQLVFLDRMLLALHPRQLPEPPPIHGQHWVP